jgi:hypothetical protein
MARFWFNVLGRDVSLFAVTTASDIDVLPHEATHPAIAPPVSL